MARFYAAIVAAMALAAIALATLATVSIKSHAASAQRRLTAGLPDVTVPNASAQAYADANSAGCTIGTSCTVGNMPPERGICVKAGLTEECWDVCNPAHAPNDYSGCPKGQPPSPTCPSELNSALSGMVSAVRQGMNSYVKCPGSLVQGDLCPPGNMCSQELSRAVDIPFGQGMCAVKADGGHVCLDVCDLKNRLSDFTQGTASGTGDKVAAMRSGTCPSNWGFTIMLIVVVILALLCCVAVGYGGLKKYMSTKKRGIKSLEAQPEFNQKEMNDNFLDHPPADQGYTQQPQDFSNQQFDYSQVEQGGYNQDYRVDSRQMYMQDTTQHDTLPPEPPRMEPVQMQQFPDPPPQAQDRRSHDSFNRFSPSQSYNQQFDFGGGMPPAGGLSQSPSQPGSVRIAGLSEPQLFSSIPPLVAPQTGVQPQLSPPDLFSQALPMSQSNMFVNTADPLGTSQPGGFAPAFLPTGSFQGQLQVPTTFTTQPPMSGFSAPSMQLNQGVQPFFTQIRR